VALLLDKLFTPQQIEPMELEQKRGSVKRFIMSDCDSLLMRSDTAQISEGSHGFIWLTHVYTPVECGMSNQQFIAVVVKCL